MPTETISLEDLLKKKELKPTDHDDKCQCDECVDRTGEWEDYERGDE